MLSVTLQFLGLALAVVPVLLVRALGPVVLIRFARLPTSRIGTLAAYPEVYLSERDAGMHRALDIFVPDKQICNRQLMRMWQRKLHVWSMARPVASLNRWLPGGGKHLVPWRTNHPSETRNQGILADTKVHIRFTAQEEERGRAETSALDIRDGAPVVCFHTRDSAYHVSNSDKDTSPHACRDSSIHSCLPAVEELVRRGYYAIRMGSVVNEPINTMNPMIIDYATSARSEFLDVYLTANCAFFICSTGGIFRLPMIFRRPCAFINFVPLGTIPTWGPNDLGIPKKLWLREEGRFLKFQEIFNRGLGEVETNFGYGLGYDTEGVDVVDNTPEEITALAVEMDERLNGTWQANEEDDELQQRFWSIFKPCRINEVFNMFYAADGLNHRSRIGSEFLRQNRDLLE